LANALFAINCTTCEARLNVRDKSAIGQIMTCPKCGSMVQIAPPPGWEEPVDQRPPQQEAPKTQDRSPSAERPRRQPSKKPASNPSQPVSPGGQAKDGASVVTTPEELAPQPRRTKPDPSTGKKVAGTSAAGVVASAAVAAGAEPPLAATQPTEQIVATELPVADATPGRHTQGGAAAIEGHMFSSDLDAPKIKDKYHYSGKGAGGQHRNKHMNCVKITHPESGVTGCGTEQKSREQNKKMAFKRLTEHPKFKAWLCMESLHAEDIERAVKEAMNPKYLNIQMWRDGKWETEGD